jgi:hypothetical protein
MRDDNGGPAFPYTAYSGIPESGMTLRDYFAAKAMQGLMGRSWQDPATGSAPDNVFDLWAKAAYATADAMLKAREVVA